MEEKIKLKDKIKNFFNDDKKRSIFILVVVIILLVSSIIIAYIFTKSPKNKNNNTTFVKPTDEVSQKIDLFKGTIVKTLDNDVYDLDLASRHKITYASNTKDRIYVNFGGEEYYYEVTLEGGILKFKEFLIDNETNLESATGNTYQYGSNIVKFVVGHNCSNFEYSIVVIDKSNDIFLYENKLDSEKTIEDIIESFTKIKTNATPKDIGYYDYSNDPFNECPQSKMVYLDKNNKLKLLDQKSTLFFDTVFYRFIGDDSQGEVIYVLKDKLMVYSNNEEYLNDGYTNILYRGSFYDDKNIYVISKDNYLYKVPEIVNGTSTSIKPISNKKITKIGNKIIPVNGYVSNKSDLVIEFEDGEIKQFKNVFEYEILG